MVFLKEIFEKVEFEKKSADNKKNPERLPSRQRAYIYEPRHEISNNVVCVASKASDQPSLTCSPIRAFAEYSMNIKLLTKHHVEFLSLTGGCTGSFESIHIKMPHC